jgi:hypothetical protein
MAGVGDLASGHLKGGEEGGRAVADVVVGAPLDPGRGDRPDWPGALQRLDLGLLVPAQHDRVGGRLQPQPDHVADLGLQRRVGGELDVSVCHGLRSCSPHPRDRAVANARLAGEQPARPVGDVSVWGGGVRVVARISARRSRRPVWGRPGRCRSASCPVSPRAHTGGARRSPSGGRCQAAQRPRCSRRLQRPATAAWPAGPARPGPERRTPSAASPQARREEREGRQEKTAYVDAPAHRPNRQITSEIAH